MTENFAPAAPPVAADQPTTDCLKRGVAGTPTIIAMVIAAAAPITCAVTLIPLAFLLGNGVGTPGAILLVSLVLALFAVGFVRIIPFVKNAGAFYAFIRAGLGRPGGLVSAYVLVVAYCALGASVVAGLGYFGHDLLVRYLDVSVSWAPAAIAGVALATALSVAGIAIAGRVLLVILAIELAAILVLDVAILVRNGLGSFTFEVFAPANVFSGAVGVAGIYAFVLFLGFEATAIYSEEAKSPERSVPRATFWVIALIGVFHVVSSWSMVAATGAEGIIPRVAEAPPLFTFGLSDEFVGSGWTDLIVIFNLLSLFAGVLAFQNAAGRYLFALSRDRALPRFLGRTHARAGTPVAALVTVGVIFVLLTVIYRAADLDPVLEVSTSLIGVGTIGLVAMLTLASVSIAAFFYTRGQRGPAHFLAPVVAAALLAACTVAAIQNYSALTGVPTGWINSLAWLYVPVVAGGLAFAFWMRANRPADYAELGRSRV